MALSANPAIRDFIESRIGGAAPAASPPPPGTSSADALAMALRGIMPAAQPFPGNPVTPIRPGAGVEPVQQGVGGPRGMLSQSPLPLGQGGGGRGDLGGSAIAAGLNKLGAGIEQGLGDIAAKRAQQQAYDDAVKAGDATRPAPYGSPARPAPYGTKPGADAGNSPFAPSPVGAANPATPIFAQPGGGAGVTGSNIGPTGSLPAFARGTPAAGPTDTAGGDPRSVAYNYFVGRGWSPNAAHAMVATLQGESGHNLNTAPLQGGDAKSGGGNGIANWDATRWRQFNNWASSNGLNPSDRATQLQYVDREARQYGVPTTSNADPRSLTYNFTGKYEAPAVNNGFKRWSDYSNGNDYAGPAPAVTASAPSGSAAYAAMPPPAVSAPLPAGAPTRSMFADAPATSPAPPSAALQPTADDVVQDAFQDRNDAMPATAGSPGPQGMNDATQPPAMNPLAVALLNDPSQASALLNIFGFGGDNAATG